eukprot:802123-Rhodomonas_salina.1
MLWHCPTRSHDHADDGHDHDDHDDDSDQITQSDSDSDSPSDSEAAGCAPSQQSLRSPRVLLAKPEPRSSDRSHGPECQ